ncbi:30S ribosomal protein S12 methylthiotransferase RimO [bacterium (Candidatus Blackallbacteria) CG17_big_fil_post_rev_8_21_14_2_50_48_46]|uniref:Ribosomal protein uS12 methylthiotransferase RimO n=1 Tax=bacterium (Candidatus Blackallbacteria) CG17_big_fil_post_rev_8_21_14_2_50_48_46 TaxID=2014261 RepID=A0A2M7G737_9BACT|nr:MAG: 30S ribosomal protein S12 methylthiotransferase RimO [bacterium (Candidatus Blackallbacteria) CG18_big_fil_WC_8_21_14_2_50_49_26]PIW17746.1 MAG: 30S ribosomal protein S12 methylthiotransferase RimO [bacterium (Candidatus Blackallbacteria) CG17_big_fil_post_rev_8_21_14_2_50_48_46]PIW47811.1 MAG: 30S ribosomal protein S12 methylthiotransferase RimO [bacterium (Candidatus Blackallbacteria) CG13_big_fil_rev_8_21_14_2_50_49_14]
MQAMVKIKSPSSAIKKVGFVSLGCPKALVDSERILTQLRAEGYEVAPSYEEAHAVIVNTCGFITPAVEESLEAIGEAMDATGKVIVTGCLGERPETVRERYPMVHAITGSMADDAVLHAIHELIPPDQNPHTALVPEAGIKLTPRHFSYLKIAEGCNHTCSFCIIPKLRGKQVSRDSKDILGEAWRLLRSGTRELLVIAQDTSAYGVDLRHRSTAFQGREIPAHLVDLATQLGETGAWVRLHYVYPYPFVDKLVELMAAGKLLPYLDVPFQHASPAVLKRMRRPGAAQQLEYVRRWRQICPEIVLRSTFIVGFPGETEEDFQLLLDFLQEARLDRVGCFTYSEVEEADATHFSDLVPEEVKQERYERFMALQQAISAEKLAARIGSEMDVVIDDYNEEPGQLIGRSWADAPEIDGQVFCVHGDLAETPEARALPAGSIKIGDRVRVRIEASDDYDLFGEVVGLAPWKIELAGGR